MMFAEVVDHVGGGPPDSVIGDADKRRRVFPAFDGRKAAIKGARTAPRMSPDGNAESVSGLFIEVTGELTESAGRTE